LFQAQYLPNTGRKTNCISYQIKTEKASLQREAFSVTKPQEDKTAIIVTICMFNEKDVNVLKYNYHLCYVFH